MRVIFAILAVFATGCAVQNAMTANDAKTKLVGLSKEQILTCMGPPSAKHAEGDTEVWQYSVAGSVTIEKDPVLNTASATQAACRAQVTFRSGSVTNLSYDAQGGGLLTQTASCARLVGRC